MIWKRLKKSTKEQDREFGERMHDEHMTFKDKIAMVLSAYLVIVLPVILILAVIGLLILWAFGAL